MGPLYCVGIVYVFTCVWVFWHVWVEGAQWLGASRWVPLVHLICGWLCIILRPAFPPAALGVGLQMNESDSYRGCFKIMNQRRMKLIYLCMKQTDNSLKQYSTVWKKPCWVFTGKWLFLKICKPMWLLTTMCPNLSSHGVGGSLLWMLLAMQASDQWKVNQGKDAGKSWSTNGWLPGPAGSGNGPRHGAGVGGGRLAPAMLVHQVQCCYTLYLYLYLYLYL